MVAPNSAEGSTNAWTWVKEVQAGDSEAFGLLYRQYAHIIRTYIARRAWPRDVEDLVSETFLRAFKRIDTLRLDESNPQAWLYRIARNLMADFYGSALYRHIEQKSLSMSSFTDSESEEFFRHFTPSAEEEFLEAQDEYLRLQSQQEWGEVLRQAMEKLIPSHRLCLNLRFVQNLSVEETARVMQKERGAIKTLQGRAVGSMRRVLKARGIVNW